MAIKLLLFLYIGASETALVYLAFRKLLHRNQRSCLQYGIALVIYAACTIFDAANDFPIYFVFIFCYVLITAISMLFYDNPLEIRVIVPFIFVSMNYSATIISTTLIWTFSGGVPRDYPVNLAQNFSSQTILCLFFMLFIFLSGGTSRLKRVSTNPLSVVLSILSPFITLILLVKLFYLGGAPVTESSLVTSRLVIAGLLLLTALTLFSVSSRANAMHESLLYSATLEQMLAMQEKYYASLQGHQMELRRISHDIKNHSRTIAGLIDHGMYQEAKEYSLTVANNTRQFTPVTDCSNQLIGALLNDKLGGLKEGGVGVTLCVMVPTVLNINNVDLCILLGNMLDNAVDACCKLSDDSRRFIDVDIRLRGPILRIGIKNSFNGECNCAEGRYFTTKADTSRHGLGMSNMKRVIDKYDGRLSITHKGDTFSVTALLCYPQGELQQPQAGQAPVQCVK